MPDYELRIEKWLTEKVLEAFKNLYDQSLSSEQITFQKTKQEFEGDITLLVFPLTKVSKKSPEETANAIGKFLKENISEIKSFNVVKGFLNLVIADDYWINYLLEPEARSQKPEASNETIMIEFSSPNTNKPLHLGHIRNNLIGHSLSEILKASGKKVVRVNLVNDRGIHICKSMLAWSKWGKNKFGEGKDDIPTENIKGDHLVGDYYVMFDRKNNEQVGRMLSGAGPTTEEYKVVPKEIREELVALGNRVGQKVADERFDIAQQNTPLMLEVKELLRKWEAGDAETISLWKEMKKWVEDGFAKTYNDLGIEFEKTYYESETYLLGKKIVEEGLSKGVFYKKDDGSVWVNLTEDGLDEKLLLRADGTSVYITQDLGTAVQRYEEYKFDKHIYVVGNEQDYHFKVLFLILKKLREANSLSFGEGRGEVFHLSYGMVDLPSGKMKSREGTVVDADDLIAEMIETAKQKTQELGKTNGLSEIEAENLHRMIGLAALKYFILKVDPKKRMLFNPEESIDFNGNTGPFIQYTYARIRSVLRKSKVYAETSSASSQKSKVAEELHPKEKSIVKLLHDFPKILSEAAQSYNPAHLANYTHELAKEYNGFYQEIPILKAEKEEEKTFRLLLSEKTAGMLKNCCALLGIEVPERM